jgi:5-methylthioadenosine/S-adenosylhomocysteine deaminase
VSSKSLNVHLSENAKDRQDEQIKAMELAGAFNAPLVVNHAIHLTDQEIVHLAKYGVKVAHNPLSNMRLASGIMRLPEMHAAGLKIGLGLDGGTNDTTDVFANMKAAMVCSALAYNGPIRSQD